MEPVSNAEREKQIAKIRGKIDDILTDESEGAVGKKFDFDHHVQLRQKINELLEEDFPFLLSELNRLQSIQQERDKLIEVLQLYTDDYKTDDGYEARRILRDIGVGEERT